MNANRMHCFRDERGESAPMLLLGAAFGAVIIGAFFAFWVSASNSATAIVSRTDQHIALLQANNAIRGQFESATSVNVLGSNELRIDTATETIRWIVEDPDGDGRGDLLSQRAPLGTDDWHAVPTKRSTGGVSVTAFERPTDVGVVRLTFDGDGDGQPDLLTSVQIP